MAAIASGASAARAGDNQIFDRMAQTGASDFSGAPPRPMSWSQNMASPLGQTLKFFIVLILSLLCLFLIFVLLDKGFHFPLGYDEAYNLQVVDSLAHGRGYASSGALLGKGSWPFDPYITTGPVILAPLAAVWALTGGSLFAVRVFMATFFFLYLAALLAIAGETRDRAVSGALAVAAALCVTLLQVGMATRLGVIGTVGEEVAGAIGDLPATAFLAWAVFFAMRDRIFWGALCIGLAIQTKVVFAAPGLVILAFALMKRAIFGANFRRDEIARAILTAAAPSLLFEFYRFLALGGAAYLASLREFRAFVHFQNVNAGGSWLDPSILGVKIARLYGLMPTPAWLALALLGSAILVLASLEPDGARAETADAGGASPAPGVNLSLASMSLAAFALLAGWITQSAQLSERQGLPFLLLAAPAIALQSRGLALRFSEAFPEFGEALSRTLLVASAILLALGLNGQIHSLRSQDWASPMAEQKKIVEIVSAARPSSLFVDRWWQNPEIQLLTRIGATPVRTGARQILIVPPYQTPKPDPNPAQQKNRCGEVLYSSPNYLVCWLE